MTNLEITTEVIDNTMLREKIEVYLREFDCNLIDVEPSKSDAEATEK